VTVFGGARDFATSRSTFALVWGKASEDKHRKKLLPVVLRSDRFLIFPWIHAPNLASHVLALAAKQIGQVHGKVAGRRHRRRGRGGSPPGE